MKFISLFSLLPAEQQTAFKKYVHSPFFNSHVGITLLFDTIYAHRSDLLSPALTPETLWITLFPQKAYSARKFNNLSSNLSQLLNDYLAYEEYKKQPVEQKRYALSATRKLGHEKQWKANLRQYKMIHERYAYRDTQNDYQQYLYHDELDKQPKRSYDENLQLKNDILDLYYLGSKLKIACDMLSRNAIIKANYTCSLIDPLLKIIEDNWAIYQQSPSILIYRQIYNMLKNKEETYYHTLKDTLKKHIRDFPIDELQTMYDYVQNYCIRKINSGETRYYREFWNLYKFLLEQNILLREGHLSEWDYKNIVTTGVRLKEYEWTEKFIRKNKQYLHANIADNAFAYNLAALYYARQNYTAALRSLHQVEFTDVSYQVGAKIIQLKSYYELNEFGAFRALTDAFRIFIKRNKQLSEYRRQANFNFIKIAKKLAQLKEQWDYKHQAFLKKEWEKHQKLLKSLEPLTNADWLVSSLEKLALF
ncbi:MAG: hypothetical protein MK212_07670 [Saprospiraceae bacterium]|nr:hypothetical protein [Saprospiraceae bacterium]